MTRLWNAERRIAGQPRTKSQDRGLELAVLPNFGKGRHRQLLDPGLLARSAARQYISVPLSHLVCGRALQQS